MRSARTSAQKSDAERDLVGELARAIVRSVAPEELGLYAETAADYFRDPGLVLRSRSRDEAVGFGLDLALLTPYVLVVGTAVVHSSRWKTNAAAPWTSAARRTNWAGLERSAPARWPSYTWRR